MVLSLFAGIVIAGFMLQDSILGVFGYVSQRISSVFYSDGEVQSSAIYVFGF